MKKIIALICIVGCMGMLFGCACNSNKTDETTNKTPEGTITNVAANSTEVQTAQKNKETVTAAPTQKATKKSNKKTQKATKAPAKPTKTKATGGNIRGSWTWEGGVFVYVFNKDGSGVYTTGSEAQHFTYTTKNNKVIIKYKDTGKVTMPYSVKGKTLILKDENDDDVIYYKTKKKK